MTTQAATLQAHPRKNIFVAIFSFVIVALILVCSHQIQYRFSRFSSTTVLIASLLLFYGPMAYIAFHHESLEQYGYTTKDFLKSLRWFIGSMAIVFPLTGIFYWAVSHKVIHFVTPSTSFMLTQFLFAALPEEGFFRGFFYATLRKNMPAIQTIILTSLAFMLVHLVSGFSLGKLFVFFPALFFGLLREKTDSIVAPVLFHTACNVFSHVINLAI